jgi:hypothetical protein
VQSTDTLGGDTCGYCAIGSANIDNPPASVMTIDKTAAKMGRSMKKRENTVESLLWIQPTKRSGGGSLPSDTKPDSKCCRSRSKYQRCGDPTSSPACEVGTHPVRGSCRCYSTRLKGMRCECRGRASPHRACPCVPRGIGMKHPWEAVAPRASLKA